MSKRENSGRPWAIWDRIWSLLLGRKVGAVAWLTWKAAFRFRLFWVVLILLLFAVLLLPLVLKSDQTARGLTQILLTYTLSAITALMGFATLWLSCGTLARDIEEAQMQVVAVKPIARWQIWLGKWIGILTLNAALLGLAGLAVYAQIMVRIRQLPPQQQMVLRNEVLVARGSIKEPLPDIAEQTEKVLQLRLKETPVSEADLGLLRQQIEEQVKASKQVVQQGYFRRWELDLGVRRFTLKDTPLFMRIKFFAAQTNASGTYYLRRLIGPPESAKVQSEWMSLSPDTFHEMVIPPNLFDEKGILTIDIINQNESSILFPLEEGMEVLYREGGFGLNFARGLAIIFFWLALLSAIGLSSASFLSFPVAAFCSIAVLIVGLSSGTLANAVQEGTILGVNPETGISGRSWIDTVAIPFFSGLLKVIKLAEDFSPIESLSTGRSISWGQLALAGTRIVLLMGGMVAMIGIAVFYRRELATAQSNQ